MLRPSIRLPAVLIGLLADPGTWATTMFNAALIGLGQKSTSDVVGFMGWLLGNGNLISQTPPGLSYDNDAVKSAVGHRARDRQWWPGRGDGLGRCQSDDTCNPHIKELSCAPSPRTNYRCEQSWSCVISQDVTGTLWG